MGDGFSQDASLAWVHTDADDGKRWSVSHVPATHLPSLLRGLDVRLLKMELSLIHI